MPAGVHTSRAGPDSLREDVRQQWLGQLRATTQRPPDRPREPLEVWHAGQWQVVGSIEPDLARDVVGASLAAVELPAGRVWRLDGAPTQALNALAMALRRCNMTGAWRDEQLQVTSPDSTAVATVERAAVRPLGIATRAVHLVGSAPDGSIWVQQRSFTKANDPGLWDTLMGGMIGAQDSLESALARETWEEAGLRLTDLVGLSHGGHVLIEKPADASSGAMGYMRERIDWFHAVVPQACQPVNQDGEVERFERLDPAVLQERMLSQAFTPEAGLVLAAYFGW